MIPDTKETKEMLIHLGKKKLAEESVPQLITDEEKI
jgi:hypothetical protein